MPGFHLRTLSSPGSLRVLTSERHLHGQPIPVGSNQKALVSRKTATPYLKRPVSSVGILPMAVIQKHTSQFDPNSVSLTLPRQTLAAHPSPPQTIYRRGCHWLPRILPVVKARGSFAFGGLVGFFSGGFCFKGCSVFRKHQHVAGGPLSLHWRLQHLPL